jgi:hypothetical protein
MLLAARIFGAAAVELIAEPKTLKAAQAEFRVKTKGFVYDPVISPSRKRPLGDEATSASIMTQNFGGKRTS